MIYEKEMAKIDASENISLVTVQALGSGNLKQKDSARLMKQLERAANGGISKKKKTAYAPKDLAEMGITVEIVKKGEDQ